MCRQPFAPDGHVVDQPRPLPSGPWLSLDAIANRFPGTVDERIVDDGAAQRVGDPKVARLAQGRLEEAFVKEPVLCAAHHRIVSGCAQEVVQRQVAVERDIACRDAIEVRSEVRAKARAGVGAVPRQEQREAAGTERRLRSAERQMPAIAGNESDLAVVAEDGTSFEEVDDAVDGPNLDRRQRHCFVGVATSDFTSTLDAARPQPRAVPQTPGTGRGRHSYPGFDR